MLRSVIPLKTVHGESHVLMLTDERNLIRVVSQVDGRTLAVDDRWQTYPGKLYLLCQKSENCFLFTARGNNNWFVSTCIQDKIISCDFDRNKTDHCVIDNSVVAVRGCKENLLITSYQCVPGTLVWHKTLQIGEFNRTTSVIVEPSEVTNTPSFLLPSCDSNSKKLIYLSDLPGWEYDLKNIVVLSLDSNTPSFIQVRCLPDYFHGYPKGKSINGSNKKLLEQGFFVRDCKFHFLEIDKSYLSTATWILQFYDESRSLTPRWQRIKFTNPIQLISKHSFQLIVNDEEEILIVQTIDNRKSFITSNDNSVKISLCARLLVPSLKYLASRVVIGVNPNLLSLTDCEQRRIGIPYGCIPSFPWMKKFSCPMSVED